MTLQAFLNKLNGVRQTRHGWMACCPAHHDKSPSLSVHEGERGVLLRCWAGCQLGDICSALNISVSDLFYHENLSPNTIRRHHIKRYWEKSKAEVEQLAKGFQIDVIREAERFLKATVGTDISTLDDTQLDTLMNSVCDALAVRLEEERGKYVNG